MGCPPIDPRGRFWQPACLRRSRQESWVRDCTIAIGRSTPNQRTAPVPPPTKDIAMFGKSWTIGRVRGVPIKIHVSLLLFLPYVAFVASMQYRTLARAMDI